MQGSDAIIDEFHRFIDDDLYPCVAARTARSRNHVPVLIADHMGCPKDDGPILEFIYDFLERFRASEVAFHSAVIVFRQPEFTTEELFDTFLWERLQSLSVLDAKKFHYDARVSSDPNSPDFSYSLGEEAFFIIGLHPGSSRPARRFRYPAIVFNPHQQFEQLRKGNRYEKMKNIVRKRDILFSGSINPMLSDFGRDSETKQYSGRRYQKGWTCPLKVSHSNAQDHPAEK